MRLSRREKQVLGLVAEGRQNKEIAAALHISESTVKNHVHSLMHKIDAYNRTELAAWYWNQPRLSFWRRLKLGIDTILGRI